MSPQMLTKRQSWPGGGDQTQMPSLWVFLIIVLGVLLALVVGTSAIMHLVQARQRRSLSRRIASGEVDLELLGLKRLNVPQEHIDKMPQYVWSSEPKEETDIKMPEPVAHITTKPENRRSTMYAQTTCSICLDDYIDRETSVRELPCNHIFHPECIDPFLKNNSSLCPLCKKSSLPAGYCPVTVTNVMVRRERLGRTLRNNRHRRSNLVMLQHARRPYVRGGTTTGQQQRPVPAEQTTTNDASTADNQTQPQDTELGLIQTDQPDAEVPPPEIASQGAEARRAWRIERLARQQSQEFDQQGEAARIAEARRPLWRRMMGLS